MFVNECFSNFFNKRSESQDVRVHSKWKSSTAELKIETFSYPQIVAQLEVIFDTAGIFHVEKTRVQILDESTLIEDRYLQCR